MVRETAARTSPVRVALVTDYDFSTGGIEQFVLQLTTRLEGSVRCSILTWSDEALLPPGADIRVVAHGDVRTVWSALSEADVIILVTSFNVRLLARVTLDYITETKTPTVTVVQTSGHSDPSADCAAVQIGWMRGILENSSVAVAVSNDVRTALSNLLKSATASPRVVVIENAARLGGTRAHRPTREIVGFIGRPTPQKGFPLYERLAQTQSSRGLTFLANTVSVPPPNPSSTIQWSYNCSDRELESFFASLDVLLVPYIRADGLPLAVQEAINCGVPIIGFDSPGVTELLRRHDQIVVEPTYEALESALIAWHQGDLVARPPVPGTVEDWGAVAHRYLDLIQQLAGRPVEPSVTYET